MATLGHLILFACYAGLAAAGALYLPRWLPGLDQTAGIIAGGFLVLLGVLFHEIMTRALNQMGLGRELRGQRDQLAELEEELTWTRREVRAVREVMEAVAKREETGDAQRLGEVMAELRILKSLVGKLAKSEARRQMTTGKASSGRAVAAGADAGGRPLPVGPARPGAGDLPASESLAVVREALRSDRVEMVLQPIVALPQRRHRAFECFSRLVTPEGRRLMPQQYLALAEDNGLITAIDNMLLFRCIQLVRRIEGQGRQHDFFCNVSLHTLRDEGFFGDFVAFLESNPELGAHLIFELSQADFAAQGALERRQLDRLAALGCRLSIDRLESLELDVEALAAQRVRFVKVEAERLTAGESEDCHRAFGALSGKLRSHRIQLIVEKIEDEAVLLEILDYGAELGQGFLFGEPKAAREAA